MVDPNIESRLKKLGSLSLQGYFGEDVKVAAEEYNILETNATLFVKLINDFYTMRSGDGDRLIFDKVDLFVQLIIIIYRESKKHDQNSARALLLAYLLDYPNFPDTCLFSRWDVLARASLAFKDAIKGGPVLAWEQTKNLAQAYNEFLNGLLGFLILAWAQVQGQAVSINNINSNYGVKLRLFEQLTGGGNGAFWLIFKIARPDVRNAIAHSSIWLDEKEGKVKYTDKGATHEMDLGEFMGLTAIGSYVGTGYLVAVAVILVMEEQQAEYVTQVPLHLQQLFNFQKSP